MKLIDKLKCFFMRYKLLKLLCILLAVNLLVSVLELPEKRYVLHDGVVNDETGTLCVMGRSGSKSVLYFYSPDGNELFKFCFVPEKGREQFNRVWVENGAFCLYCHEDNTIYYISEDGEVIKNEKASSDYWETREAWEDWDVKKNTFTYVRNGVEYEYKHSDYFTLKFTKQNRELRITTVEGKEKLIWDSSLRDEVFEDFPVDILAKIIK